MLLLELFLAVPVALGPLPAPVQEPAPEPNAEAPERLDPRPAELIDALVQRGPGAAEVRAAAPGIFDAIIAAHGDLGLADSHLAGIVASPADPAVRRAARRLGGLLAWRFGDLSAAADAFAELAKDSGDLDARLTHARLLDADSRSDEALEAYGALVETGGLDEQVESQLRLRMALMSMESGGEEQKDALADFAREEGRPVELRNRCAIVLALLGRPGDAADLYVVPDLLPADAEISERKRRVKAAASGELRVAEWALRAEDWARAQGAAWRAVHLSPVARERRYGLTLLAEAHRGDGSLAALLERFAAEREGLPAEARRAWIELLRETGASGDAIEMVEAEGAEVFTKDERRRLLEMYREAGREDDMVATFREWIAAEPDELVWRSGLARHFLEAGTARARSTCGSSGSRCRPPARGSPRDPSTWRTPSSPSGWTTSRVARRSWRSRPGTRPSRPSSSSTTSSATAASSTPLATCSTGSTSTPIRVHRRACRSPTASSAWASSRRRSACWRACAASAAPRRRARTSRCASRGSTPRWAARTAPSSSGATCGRGSSRSRAGASSRTA